MYLIIFCVDTEACLGPEIAIVCMASDVTMTLQDRYDCLKLTFFPFFNLFSYSCLCIVFSRDSMSLLLRSTKPPLEAAPKIVESGCDISSSSRSYIELDVPVDGVLNLNMDYHPLDDRVKRKKHVWLPRRSLLILRGEARYFWSHAITPRKCDKHNGVLIPRSRRVSLTFRQVMRPGDFPDCRIQPSLIEKRYVKNNNADLGKFDAPNNKSLDTIETEFIFKQLKKLDGNSLIAGLGMAKSRLLNCFSDFAFITLDADTTAFDPARINSTDKTFDFVFCINSLSNLSNLDRRSAALRELVRITKLGGNILIVARAFLNENGKTAQQDTACQKCCQSSGQKQDILITSSNSAESVNEFRFSHLFKESEIEDLLSCIPGNRVVESRIIGKLKVVSTTRVADSRFDNCPKAPDSAMPTLARID